MTRRLALAAVAATALLFALLPAAASARGGDRNNDRIPDRWEHAHKLSLDVKQTSRDQDDDGLRNLAEYRNHTDPRDADSDNDGLDDGEEVKVGLKPRDRDSDDDGRRDDDENAGTVQSFAAGKLTIALAGGDTLTAAVVDGVTEIECEGHDGPSPATTPATARLREHGDHGDHGAGEHGDDDAPGDDEHGANDDHGDDHNACTAASLAAGTVVHEAEVKTSGGRAVFTEIKLRLAA